MHENGNFPNSDIHISTRIGISTIHVKIMANFVLINIRTRCPKLHAIIGPIAIPINRFVIKKYGLIVLKWKMLIGRMIICADIVTDVISSIFPFIHFFNIL